MQRSKISENDKKKTFKFYREKCIKELRSRGENDLDYIKTACPRVLCEKDMRPYLGDTKECKEVFKKRTFKSDLDFCLKNKEKNGSNKKKKNLEICKESLCKVDANPNYSNTKDCDGIVYTYKRDMNECLSGEDLSSNDSAREAKKFCRNYVCSGDYIGYPECKGFVDKSLGSPPIYLIVIIGFIIFKKFGRIGLIIFGFLYYILYLKK